MDDLIANIHYDELMRLRREVVGECDECDDGYIYDEVESDKIELYPVRSPCNCMNDFLEKAEYLTAQIPRLFWKTQKLRQVESREYLFEKEKYGKSKRFNKTLKKFVSNIDAVMEHGLSFVFAGMNGSGKTHVATYILKKFMKKDKICYYVYFRDLLGWYYTGFIGKDKQAKQVLKYIKEVDLLCIDEIGKENSVTNVALSEFETVLKTRLENSLPTILITNKSMVGGDDAFRETYGESIWDVLKLNYKMFIFNPNADMRLQQRKDWNKILL